VSGNETQTAIPPRAGFQPDDLLRQAQIQDVALSPDGTTVTYCRRVIADERYWTHL
jgi:hypothetical protein